MVKAATSQFPIATYAGASLGLLASNSIGMLVGQFTKGRVSEKTLKFFGASIFIGFGVYYIFTAARKFGLI
jgi:putative Ca2+/H+ antiporter (TMEM165/GDT1 family)